MGEINFAVEPGGPTRVKCRWDGLFNNIHVLFDGQEIGRFPDKDAAKRGGTLRAPDGSDLGVIFKDDMKGPRVEVTRNGAPMPRSAADSAQAFKGASDVLFFIGGLNMALGAAAVGGVELLQTMGLGLGSLVQGGLYVALGVFTRRGSRVALGVGMALFGIDAIYALIAPISAGHSPAIGGIVVRAAIFMGLFKSFNATSAAKKLTAST